MAKPGEKFKTEHGVFDAFTNRVIFKLISEGHFEGLKSPISIGKESNVFSAEAEDKKLVTVKIYRLETADFNRMYDYIKFDPRFGNILKRRRKVIFAWAKREYRNLLLAREAGVSSPMPLTARDNVLVEEFIGNDGPAPRLVNSPPKNPKKFFAELMANIRKLYNAGLTHGDLSQFNILNHGEKPVLIDFSHTTTDRSQQFNVLFERDVKVVCDYFNRLGLPIDKQKALNTITRK